MNNEITIPPGERGVEVWKAFDCPVCDAENSVSERAWHPEVRCSNCEQTFEVALRPVE